MKIFKILEKKTIKISDKQIIKKIKLNNKKKSIKHKIYASHSNILNQITKIINFLKMLVALQLTIGTLKKIIYLLLSKVKSMTEINLI